MHVFACKTKHMYTADGQQVVVPCGPKDFPATILRSLQAKVVETEKAGLDARYVKLYKEFSSITE